MSAQTILELLGKQKLVEGMVRSQRSNRQDVVEGIVHKQHVSDLAKAIARQSAADLGEILEKVGLEDAKRVWPLIPDDRRPDILWEISKSLRAGLVGEREPVFEHGRITAYVLEAGRVRVVDVERQSQFEALDPVWIDIQGASPSERDWIARQRGLDLPDPDDLTDLEASARFYEEEKDEIHLHANFLVERGGIAHGVPVACVIKGRALYTIREADSPVFRLLRLRARGQTEEVMDRVDFLLDLYGANIEHLADLLEEMYAKLRRVGQEVLNEDIDDGDAARILAEIAREEDLNGLIRGNMLDTQRAVSFLIRGRFLSPAQLEDAREIIRDIDSLNSHTNFLFEKINFLMDATIGFINVNQNRRVTQLTIVSVVFMPINVLAGVGGMSEFSMMTHGIPWPISYAALLVGLVFVGWLTYALLKIQERRRMIRANRHRRAAL